MGKRGFHGIGKAVAVVPLLALAALPLHAAGYDSYRIMSFNICHCATNNTLSVGDEEVRRTARVIAAQSPDFACLQEVDQATTRSSGIDEPERIAELLTEASGVQHYGVFGKSRDYRGGGYGNAIVARHKPLSSSVVLLEGSSEVHSLLLCEFDDFYVATTHLDLNRNYRTNSIPVIRELLASLQKPVFLTGDWNATPTSDATIPMMREFLTIVSPTGGVSTFTPRDGTDYVIDYIAIDSDDADRFLVRRAWGVPNMVDGEYSSDHNPVLVDLVARPAAASLAWVEENAIAAGMTGAWSRDVAYDPFTLKAELVRDCSFAPFAPSGGNVVTGVVTATFQKCQWLGDPDAGIQAAVRLGTNGCFQVWTRGVADLTPAAAPEWLDVAIPGITPVDGGEYTFRVVIDYRLRQYAVELLDGESGARICAAAAGHATNFHLAAPGLRVSAIDFAGETTFTSLLGGFGSRPCPTTFLAR